MPKFTQIAEIDAGYHEAPRDLVNGVRKCVVPLCIFQDGQLKSIGTGTIISSWGMVLTAAHVLEAAIRAGRPRAKDGRRYQEYDLYALVRTGESPPGSKACEIGGLVQVVDIWTVDSLDIGFCAMSAMTHKDTASMVWPGMSMHTGWSDDKPKTMLEAAQQEFIAFISNGYDVLMNPAEDGSIHLKLTYPTGSAHTDSGTGWQP